MFSGFKFDKQNTMLPRAAAGGNMQANGMMFQAHELAIYTTSCDAPTA
jgi:hypothetical protein